MIAAIPDVVVSAELLQIGKGLALANLDELPEIAAVLIKLADLAHAQELELGLLRDMEAGRELRVEVRRAVDAQIAPQAGDTSGNVVVTVSDFARRRRT